MVEDDARGCGGLVASALETGWWVLMVEAEVADFKDGDDGGEGCVPRSNDVINFEERELSEGDLSERAGAWFGESGSWLTEVMGGLIWPLSTNGSNSRLWFVGGEAVNGQATGGAIAGRGMELDREGMRWRMGERDRGLAWEEEREDEDRK
jgi:hypothetical protein